MFRSPPLRCASLHQPSVMFGNWLDAHFAERSQILALPYDRSDSRPPLSPDYASRYNSRDFDHGVLHQTEGTGRAGNLSRRAACGHSNFWGRSRVLRGSSFESTQSILKLRRRGTKLSLSTPLTWNATLGCPLSSKSDTSWRNDGSCSSRLPL